MNHLPAIREGHLPDTAVSYELAGTIEGASFNGLRALSVEAGLDVWRETHSSAFNIISRHTEAAFQTPIPSADVEAWRQAGGYEYGDSPGEIKWAIGVVPQEEDVEGDILAPIDTGVRLLAALPNKGEDTIPWSANHPYLALGVTVSRNWRTKPAMMRGKIGHDQIDTYTQLKARSAQELLLVAARFIDLAKKADPQALLEPPAVNQQPQPEQGRIRGFAKRLRQ